jgi:hypothetical protein
MLRRFLAAWSLIDTRGEGRLIIGGFFPWAMRKTPLAAKGCATRNIAYLTVRTLQHCGSSTALNPKIGSLPIDHSEPTPMRQFVDSGVDKRRGAGL